MTESRRAAVPMPGEPDVIREPGTRRIQYHAGMISHPQSGYADHQRMVGWFVLTAQVGSGMPLTGRVVHYATNDVDPFEKTRAVVEASWEGGPTAAEVADSGLLRCQMMYEPVSGTIDWDAPDEVIIDTLYGRLVLRSSAEHSAE